MTREESKQATRQALLLAGLHEINEHGLDGPSLDAICARAGYTRGAFYVHFKNREDFSVAIMEWLMGMMFDYVIGDGSDDDDLLAMIQRFAEAITANEIAAASEEESVRLKSHQFLDAVARSPRLTRRFAEIIHEGAVRIAKAVRQGQENGTIRRDVDADEIAAFMMFTGGGVMQLRDVGIPIKAGDPRRTIAKLLEPR